MPLSFLKHSLKINLKLDFAFFFLASWKQLLLLIRFSIKCFANCKRITLLNIQQLYIFNPQNCNNIRKKISTEHSEEYLVNEHENRVPNSTYFLLLIWKGTIGKPYDQHTQITCLVGQLVVFVYLLNYLYIKALRIKIYSFENISISYTCS